MGDLRIPNPHRSNKRGFSTGERSVILAVLTASDIVLGDLEQRCRLADRIADELEKAR